MSNVWFTSDLHFGHEKVAELRGFGSIDEHDDAIMHNIASAVRMGDQLWILGDISSGSSSSEAEALARINTLAYGLELHLITGNHDSCSPVHRDSHKHLAKFYDAGFSSVQAFARRRIEGRQVMLSHFPYERDRNESRYMQYRLRNEGLWLLHGHTHGTERITYQAGGWEEGFDGSGAWTMGSTPDSREIHVGLDAWDLKPVPLHAIANLMGEELSLERMSRERSL